jgi:ribonuclease BN (tRNA processing enzyme)/tetratricopeptide (TPR) repeat protein
MAGLVAFRKLFWAARQAHVKAGKNAGADLPEHQVARSHAQEHGLVWAELLLDASLLICQGKPDEAFQILLAVEKTVPETEAGIVSLLIGAARQEKGDYEAATASYERASQDTYSCGGFWATASLDHDEGPDSLEKLTDFRTRIEDRILSPHWTGWWSLGEALEKGGYYEDACDAYQEALKDPTAELRGPLLIKFASSLIGLGNHEGAIKACREALENSQFEQRGLAWLIIGLAQRGMELYEEAAESLEKARKEFGDEAPDILNFLLADAYWRIGRFEDARPLLEELFSKKEGEKFLRAEVRSQLFSINLYHLIRSNLTSRNGQEVVEAKPGLSSVTEETLGPNHMLNSETALRMNMKRASPTGDRIELLDLLRSEPLEARIFDKIETARKTQYEKYLSRVGSHRDNVLAILRGWSSSVTLLEGSERLWKGGGYFVKWQGKGIVIDPGFDFLRNFHDKGYHGREIDAVLVSHNHSDHNADLKSIDDLLYELYLRKGEDPHGGVSPYLLLQDAGTKESIKLDVEHSKHRYPPMLFDTANRASRHVIVRPENLPFSVEYFPVKHGDELKDPVGFTLVLQTENEDAFRLGFTGDTEYFDDLEDHLKECDLLLAHISQPDDEDFTDPRHRKKNHLGYRGLGELIKRCEPRLTIVSEFWSGFTDLRIDLVMALRSLTGNPRIFPASIGMHVHLPKMEVECSACNQKTSFDEVGVAASVHHFGSLAYLCPSCLLKPPGKGEAILASGFPLSRE